MIAQQIKIVNVPSSFIDWNQTEHIDNIGFHFAGTISTVHCVCILLSYQSIYCKTMSQANPGVVTTLDNRMHGLQTGDKVTFKEIVGMTVINGSEQTVKGKKLNLCSQNFRQSQSCKSENMHSS